MIELKNVSKIYQSQKALDNVSLVIQDGEFFVLVGKSGSGKTTTLKMLNRLIEPTSGSILADGIDIQTRNLRELRLETGYVLQQGALFPNLTVLENITLIPEMKKWDKARRVSEAKRLLEQVGLDPVTYADKLPNQLSGGEKQRVGILRAMITQPKVLLMDEPFSALDPISRTQLQALTKQLHDDYQMTIVFVTHDMQEAVALGDRICVMKDGRVLQIDTPQMILEHPATQEVAALFTGGMSYE